MAPLGKALIVTGLILVVLGAAVWGFGSGSITGPLPGRLPGDIYLRRGNFSFYFPLTTSIIVSLVLSLIVAWLRR
jgi:formate hydrogenlyase subunit 3/multisubunit Na+/H+ antiporter MnhD subunit